MKARRKSDGKQEKDAELKSMCLSDVKEKIDKWMDSHTEEEVYELLKKYGAVEDADTVIQGWVFVDETTFDRILCVRKVTQREYEAVWDSGHPEFCLGNELFPDMVPNTLPEPVEIIIKRKKK